jgi:hypothetical protein
MKIDNWQPYFKIDENTGELHTTQMVYEPLVNDDGSIFCMNFSFPNLYQSIQAKKYPEFYTDDFVNWIFLRELYFLDKFATFSWCPQIIKIDKLNRRIFFSFHGATCNDILYNTDDMQRKNYIIQKFENLLLSQVNAGIYKITLYPHSCFLDSNGVLKAFDLYGCCTEDDHYIEIERIKALLGDSYYRFTECYEGDMINLKEMFKNTLSKYSFWPAQLTNNIYEKFNWNKL